jgi:hypothetical protein
MTTFPDASDTAAASAITGRDNRSYVCHCGTRHTGRHEYENDTYPTMLCRDHLIGRIEHRREEDRRSKERIVAYARATKDPRAVAFLAMLSEDVRNPQTDRRWFEWNRKNGGSADMSRWEDEQLPPEIKALRDRNPDLQKNTGLGTPWHKGHHMLTGGPVFDDAMEEEAERARVNT